MPLIVAVLVSILISLPLLAAVLLACYPAILKRLRALPPHEYEQAVRAPAWLAVAVGGGIMLLSAWMLTMLGPSGGQVFLKVAGRSPEFLVDAYSLWSSALLGVILAVAAWVPAARRSLIEQAVPCFSAILLLFWFALLLIFSLSLIAILWDWLILLAGVTALWYWLYRPKWRFMELDVLTVLGLAAIFGIIGLLWLNKLGGGKELPAMWGALLIASPPATNASTLMIALAWMGPTVFLPWWVWGRKDEAAMVWLPACLIVGATGALSLARLLFQAFPIGSIAFRQATGTEEFFLISRALGWMFAWGVLALLVGAGLLAANFVLRKPDRALSLRPFSLVAAGMLLIGMSSGVQGQEGQGMSGLLWMLLTWAGSLTTLLAGSALFSALARSERAERTTLLVSLGLAMLTLVALPPLAGYRALANLWMSQTLPIIPGVLIVAALLLAAISGAILLRRWAKDEAAPVPRPGIGWGIIGPFALILITSACSLLATRLAPLFAIIERGLQQRY